MMVYKNSHKLEMAEDSGTGKFSIFFGYIAAIASNCKCEGYMVVLVCECFQAVVVCFSSRMEFRQFFSLSFTRLTEKWPGRQDHGVPDAVHPGPPLFWKVVQHPQFLQSSLRVSVKTRVGLETSVVFLSEELNVSFLYIVRKWERQIQALFNLVCSRAPIPSIKTFVWILYVMFLKMLPGIESSQLSASRFTFSDSLFHQHPDKLFKKANKMFLTPAHTFFKLIIKVLRSLNFPIFGGYFLFVLKLWLFTFLPPPFLNDKRQGDVWLQSHRMDGPTLRRDACSQCASHRRAHSLQSWRRRDGVAVGVFFVWSAFSTHGYLWSIFFWREYFRRLSNFFLQLSLKRAPQTIMGGARVWTPKPSRKHLFSLTNVCYKFVLKRSTKFRAFFFKKLCLSLYKGSLCPED